MAKTCKFKLFVDNVSDASIKLNEIARNQIEVPAGTTVKWIASKDGFQSDMGEIKLDSSVAITVHLARNDAKVKNTYTKLYKDEDGKYVTENSELTPAGKCLPASEGQEGKVLSVMEGGFVDWVEQSGEGGSTAALERKVQANTTAIAEVKSSVSDLDAKVDSSLAEKAEKNDVVALSEKVDLKAEKSVVEGLSSKLSTVEQDLIVDKKNLADNYWDSNSTAAQIESSAETVKAELSVTLNKKADKATTLEGYGIADAYTKAEVDAKTSSFMKYKGQVETTNDLPQDAEIGDVYNVKSTGANYAWDGSEWDKLSETIDLSVFAEKSEVNEKVAGISEDLNVEKERALAAEEAAMNEVAKKQDKFEVAENLKLEENKLDVNKDKVVTFSDYEGRKIIQLENHDAFSGIMTTGEGANLAMISKWDVADFGSVKVHLNLNSKDAATINDNDTIATDKDLALKADKEEVSAISEKLDLKADKTALDDVDAKFADKADTYSKAEVDEKITSIDLSALATKEEMSADLALKANKADVDTSVAGLNTSLESKADKVDLEDLSGKVELKAEKSELTSEVEGLNGSINLKADKSELNSVKQTAISASGSAESALTRLTALEERVSQLAKTSIEPVTIETTEPTTLSDTTKDYVISGNIAATLNATGKSVDLKGVEVTNDARVKVSAAEETRLIDTTITGEFKKSSGNTVVAVSNSETITFRNMNIDATLYNCIEIGLSGDKLAKNILFENCNFRGNFTNNAVSIFGTQANAVVNFNNCYFEHVSNVLRLSNRTNTSMTVNFTNCSCDYWETVPKWAGMLICQDYTSPLDKVEENNLFAPEKIIVNIYNFKMPGGELMKPIAEEDMPLACGSQITGKQLFYVYTDKDDKIHPYVKERYPKINIA